MALTTYQSLIFIVSVNANEKDCSKFDKLSKDYTKCIADKAKKKGKKIKDKVTSKETKIKISNFGKKLKKGFSKFKNSKTLKELTE